MMQVKAAVIESGTIVDTNTKSLQYSHVISVSKTQDTNVTVIVSVTWK